MSCLAIIPVRGLGGSLLTNLELFSDIVARHPMNLLFIGPSVDSSAIRGLIPQSLRSAEFLRYDMPRSDTYWPAEQQDFLANHIARTAKRFQSTSLVLGHDCLLFLVSSIRRLRCELPIMAVLHGTPSHSLESLDIDTRQNWLEGISIVELLVSVSLHLVPSSLQNRAVLLPYRTPTIPDSLDALKKEIDVIHVSTGRTVKRPRDVLSVFKNVRTIQESIRCRAVITNPEVAATFRSEGIETTGELSPGAALELIGQSKVLLLASEAEGFPRVVLEALSLGAVPVISDRANRSGTVVDGQTGYIFPFGDIELATRAILMALLNPIPSFANVVRQLVRTLEVQRENTLGRIVDWLKSSE